MQFSVITPIHDDVSGKRVNSQTNLVEFSQKKKRKGPKQRNIFILPRPPGGDQLLPRYGQENVSGTVAGKLPRSGNIQLYFQACFFTEKINT